MGLDMYLVAAHNRKEIEDKDFWSDLPDYSHTFNDDDGDYSFDTSAIVCYWRKYWDLFNHLNGENCEWKEISREDLEDILSFTCHNPDYWDSFNTVPTLCTVLYNYNILRKNGLKLFFWGDY